VVFRSNDDGFDSIDNDCELLLQTLFGEKLWKDFRAAVPEGYAQIRGDIEAKKFEFGAG